MATVPAESKKAVSAMARRHGADLDVSDLGTTIVDDTVVTTIASLAAQEVDGVHRLGSTGLRGMVSRVGRHAGVDSQVGQKQAAITLDVIVEFGHRLTDVGHALRERVIQAVEYMADREVVAVDIHFVDVHVPGAEPSGTHVVE
jgi:uncharacterized alkaline shock family protein YloU